MASSVSGKVMPSALAACHCFLDLAILNVKDSVRRVALREDFLILVIGRLGPPAVHRAQDSSP
jgi:hypothetical protein